MDFTVYHNGKFIKESEVSLSIFDFGFIHGDGIRVDFPIYQRKPFKPQLFIERLFDSAERTGIKINITEKAIERTIKALLDLNSLKDALATILITRGDFQLLPKTNLVPYPNTYIFTLPLPTIAESFSYQGVTLKSCEKRSIPYVVFDRQIFTISQQQQVLALNEIRKAGHFEGVFFNFEGYLSECTHSNIFLVKENELLTPDLSCDCLNRVIREVIQDLTKDSELNFKETFLTQDDIFNSDECFIGNAQWGVLPVIELDSQIVGKGRPGKFTRQFSSQINTLKNHSS